MTCNSRQIKSLLIFTFLLLGHIAQAQNFSLSGKVIDATTFQPLAFVNIVTNNSNLGTSTDIDGKFEIAATQKIEFLRLSYVGYLPKTFYLSDTKENLEILLEKTSVELTEVVIVAGENPAHRIIQNVIDNKDLNDPEKMQSFSYTAYDKMVFTIDTLEIAENEEVQPDSATIRLKNFLRDKDFFMMETVSERKFLSPDRNHEKVLASRISGFKDPVLLFLSSQLQSSTFYNELIKISDKNYINPISRGSLNKYFFQLEDTTYTASGDSVFVISFRPRINTNFDGLKGVLSINTHGWAIQNVIAEPSRNNDGLSIKIQQMYELIDGEKWFPVQLNTDIIFNNVKVNNAVPVGKGKSYHKNIVLNPELVKRQFNQISIEFDPNASDRPEDFWLTYRGDSLTSREKRTYEYIDSVGKKANLDRMAYTIKSLLNNRLPLGYVDLDLARIAKYNDFEGLYLGLGFLTSSKLSQTFEAGAFWGMGLRDKNSKYGGSLSATIDRYREIKLNLEYFYDVTETGGVNFYGEAKNFLNPANIRNFLIRRMDLTERIHASASFRALRYGTINVGILKDSKQVTNDYYFKPGITANEDLVSTYHFTELSAGFRYAYKEKFLEMPDAKMSLGTKYPVIWFQFTRGLNGTLNGEYAYNKFDLKIEKSFFIKYIGESKFVLQAGYVEKPIPQSNLYNGRASYRVFTVYAPNSFATQRMNEFLADRYAFLFYTHNFGKLLWRGQKFSPEFAFVTNVGFGNLNHPEYHQGTVFNIMNKGYYESGLLINNLLNMNGIYSLGVGTFYRYGYYHLPNMADNFGWKITILFPF